MAYNWRRYLQVFFDMAEQDLQETPEHATGGEGHADRQRRRPQSDGGGTAASRTVTGDGRPVPTDVPASGPAVSTEVAAPVAQPPPDDKVPKMEDLEKLLGGDNPTDEDPAAPAGWADAPLPKEPSTPYNIGPLIQEEDPEKERDQEEKSKGNKAKRGVKKGLEIVTGAIFMKDKFPLGLVLTAALTAVAVPAMSALIGLIANPILSGFFGALLMAMTAAMIILLPLVVRRRKKAATRDKVTAKDKTKEKEIQKSGVIQEGEYAVRGDAQLGPTEGDLEHMEYEDGQLGVRIGELEHVAHEDGELGPRPGDIGEFIPALGDVAEEPRMALVGEEDGQILGVGEEELSFADGQLGPRDGSSGVESDFAQQHYDGVIGLREGDEEVTSPPPSVVESLTGPPEHYVAIRHDDAQTGPRQASTWDDFSTSLASGDETDRGFDDSEHIHMDDVGTIKEGTDSWDSSSDLWTDHTTTTHTSRMTPPAGSHTRFETSRRETAGHGEPLRP